MWGIFSQLSGNKSETFCSFDDFYFFIPKPLSSPLSPDSLHKYSWIILISSYQSLSCNNSCSDADTGGLVWSIANLVIVTSTLMRTDHIRRIVLSDAASCITRENTHLFIFWRQNCLDHRLCESCLDHHSAGAAAAAAELSSVVSMGVMPSAAAAAVERSGATEASSRADTASFIAT